MTLRVSAAGLFAALALLAAGCGGEDEGYSAEVESNFMEQCVPSALESGKGALSEAKAREYCQCGYDEIEATVPYEEFAEYDEKAREDPSTPLPPKMKAVIERCGEQIAEG